MLRIANTVHISEEDIRREVTHMVARVVDSNRRLPLTENCVHHLQNRARVIGDRLNTLKLIGNVPLNVKGIIEVFYSRTLLGILKNVL